MEQYTDERLRELLSAIQEPDHEAEKAAAAYQESLAKPPRSLGKLEQIAVRLAGITGRLKSRTDRRRIIVLCADNGVAEEGVSCTPVSVTMSQAVNMTRGLTGMSCLAREFGCEVQVVDVGIATPYRCPAIVNRSIAKGTRNLAKEPAMTREEALRGIFTGFELARSASEEGVELIGVGEMGIGNTTTSSAILSALTGLPVSKVTGRGGGLLDEAFRHKKEVIESALKSWKPNPEDPVDVLSKVGGFDIAAMCGVFLGAAAYRVPAVIDGFVSIVAALLAVRLSARAAHYLFPSHASYEIGYERAAAELGLEPWLLLNMRLGEGSGCPLAFEVIRAACAVMERMATFSQASIDDSYLDEIRPGDRFSVERE